jgi:hypothetical protein
LVSDRATVSLIDADSFQFSSGGEVFHCEVGVPEYTPPELQGQSLGGVTRSMNHDRFGLAVVVFQLLMMGRHPFSGTPRRGDMLPLSEAIRQGRYVYSEVRDAGFDQPPGTPAVSEVSPAIGSLFERAFGSRAQSDRPTANEWFAALDRFESELQRCKTNPMHLASPPIDECPWCEMEGIANVILFVPPSLHGATLTGQATRNSDLHLVVAELRKFSLPPRDKITPLIGAYVIEMNPATSSVGIPPYMSVALRTTVVLGAIVLTAGLPFLWFVWIPLAYFLYGVVEQGDNPGNALTEDTMQAGQEWLKALIGWQRKIGVDTFILRKEEANRLAVEWEGLTNRKQTELDRVHANRRTAQLLAYLDGFEIRRAKIKGIGPSRLAQLVSYGIETAADIDKQRLLSVPGFGEAVSQPLFDWKTSLEKRFVFDPRNTATDQAEITRINDKYIARSKSLEQSLRAAVEELTRLRGQITTEMSKRDPTVAAAFIRLQEKRMRLREAKLPVPVIRYDWPAAPVLRLSSPTTPSGSTNPSSSHPGAATATSASAGRVTCPRCGSAMQRRIARRGSRAGNSFWGCSRFPVCRGTRN